MAFDVHYTRNPFIDAFLAYFAGRSQSQRQNDVLESQMQFQASQQSAQGLGRGLNMFSNYLYNRMLQDRGIEGRMALEQLQQSGMDQRQQASLGQQNDQFFLGHYGETRENIQEQQPGLPIGEAAANVNMQRQIELNQMLQQAQQQQIQQQQAAIEQVATQAGMAKSFQPMTMNGISTILSGIDKMIVDPTLTLQQKQQFLQKAKDDLALVARPTWGPRKTPPSVQERMPAEVQMVPGLAHAVVADAHGNLKFSNALTAAPPDFSNPEVKAQNFQANTYTDDDGNVWSYKPKSQSWEIEKGASESRGAIDIEKTAEEAVKIANSGNYDQLGFSSGDASTIARELYARKETAIRAAEEAAGIIPPKTKAEAIVQEKVDRANDLLQKGAVPYQIPRELRVDKQWYGPVYAVDGPNKGNMVMIQWDEVENGWYEKPTIGLAPQ